MKTGVALFGYITWIYIHLHVADLDSDNDAFGVASEISLQNSSVCLSKTIP